MRCRPDRRGPGRTGRLDLAAGPRCPRRGDPAGGAAARASAGGAARGGHPRARTLRAGERCPARPPGAGSPRESTRAGLRRGGRQQRTAAGGQLYSAGLGLGWGGRDPTRAARPPAAPPFLGAGARAPSPGGQPRQARPRPPTARPPTARPSGQSAPAAGPCGRPGARDGRGAQAARPEAARPEAGRAGLWQVPAGEVSGRSAETGPARPCSDSPSPPRPTAAGPARGPRPALPRALRVASGPGLCPVSRAWLRPERGPRGSAGARAAAQARAGPPAHPVSVCPAAAGALGSTQSHTCSEASLAADSSVLGFWGCHECVVTCGAVSAPWPSRKTWPL